jgi:hypothetical protein
MGAGMRGSGLIQTRHTRNPRHKKYAVEKQESVSVKTSS